MQDEGFARNIRNIFGTGGEYHDMAGKPLKAVAVSDNDTKLTFSFEDGTEAVFEAEGDCCSRSWIEHLELPSDLSGKTLVEVTDERISREDDVNDYECLQVYQTKFRLSSGETISVEYRNSSNGYYGGYLTRLE